MAMMQHPQAPARPPQPRSWLKDEWDHWESMPPLRFCLLALPNLVLFAIDPLLPIAASLLQFWAASAWTWRDRWASVWDMARKGVWIVTLIVALASLAAAHFWFFPALVAILQGLWSGYLPGMLDLSPLNGHDLIARSLLLLPLAPALALYNEWIDPRTTLQPQPMPRPEDLVPPPVQTVAPPQEVQDQATPQDLDQTVDAATQPSTTAAPPPPKKRRPRKKTTGTPSGTPQAPAAQLTIDNVLAHDPHQAPQPTAMDATQQKDKGHATSVPQQTTGGTLKPEDINWDDVVG